MRLRQTSPRCTSHRCTLALAAGLLALLAAPRNTLAAEPTGAVMVFRNERAQVCPDAERVATAVAALMDRPALRVAPAPADVQLAVSLRCDDDGCGAQVLSSGSASGLRELHDPDPTCAGLADALAVSIAVLLDWQGPQAPTPQAPAPQAAEKAAPASPGSSLTPASTPLHLGVFSGLGAAFGLLPSASLSLDAGFVLSLPNLPVRFALGVHWLPEQSMDFHQGTIHTRLVSERLTGCVPLLKGPVELAPCASLTLGHFRAVGSRFADNSTVNATWLLGGLGAELLAPLGERFSLSAQALGQVSARELTVSVSGLGKAVELGHFGLTTQLALTVSFL